MLCCKTLNLRQHLVQPKRNGKKYLHRFGDLCDRLPMDIETTIVGTSESSGTSETMSPVICENIGDYTITRQIGEGSYGDVFEAISPEGEYVAIKKSKSDGIREAQHEARIGVFLNNENVVSPISAFPHDDTYCTVYPLAKGDLWYQPSKKEDIKSVMKQILEGLEYLHSQCIVHSDMKTANVLNFGGSVQNGPNIQITDLGLAKRIPCGYSGLPHNQYVGTMYYRAPELIFHERMYGTPIDMWAAGCIMAELLTGEVLFYGRDEYDMVKKYTKVLGAVNEDNYPGVSTLFIYKHMRRYLSYEDTNKNNSLQQLFIEQLDTHGLELLKGLLRYNPQRRLTAAEALKSKWFLE